MDKEMCHGCGKEIPEDSVNWATEQGLLTTGKRGLPWCDACLPDPGILVDVEMRKVAVLRFADGGATHRLCDVSEMLRLMEDMVEAELDMNELEVHPNFYPLLLWLQVYGLIVQGKYGWRRDPACGEAWDSLRSRLQNEYERERV